jgi:hypothetical protein
VLYSHESIIAESPVRVSGALPLCSPRRLDVDECSRRCESCRECEALCNERINNSAIGFVRVGFQMFPCERDGALVLVYRVYEVFINVGREAKCRRAARRAQRGEAMS